MKRIHLTLAVAAALLAAHVQSASAENLFDNIRNGLNNLGKPPAERQQVQRTGEKPKLFESLKRGFNDFAASQRDPAPNLPKKYQRQVVSYQTREAPGTIIIDPREYFLYFVTGDGRAIRYGVGVGREGFGWHGTTRIGRKAEWPGWTPPQEMIAREKKKGVQLPAHMEGGMRNPLGARALYLYNGGGDTAYRIHGSNEPWTIGRNVSSGCFRMLNKDVIDLYKRARVGAKVVVL